MKHALVVVAAVVALALAGCGNTTTSGGQRAARQCAVLGLRPELRRHLRPRVLVRPRLRGHLRFRGRGRIRPARLRC